MRLPYCAALVGPFPPPPRDLPLCGYGEFPKHPAAGAPVPDEAQDIDRLADSGDGDPSRLGISQYTSSCVTCRSDEPRDESGR